MRTMLRYRNCHEVFVDTVNWIGQASLDELGLADPYDDSSVLVSVSDRGDELIVMVMAYMAAIRDDGARAKHEARHGCATGYSYEDRLWAEFCAAVGLEDYRETLPADAAAVMDHQLELGGLHGVGV